MCAVRKMIRSCSMQFAIVVFLLVATPWHVDAFLNHERLAEYSLTMDEICELECFQDILDEDCGDLMCSDIERIAEYTDAICTPECRKSLIGESMERCLTNSLPRRTDFAGLMEFFDIEYECTP